MLLYVYLLDRIGNRIGSKIKISWADKRRFTGYKIKWLVMKDEITLLREENKRLNTIIQVLTEKLQETVTLLSAYDKNKIGINNVVDGIPENKIGVSNLTSAYDKNMIGGNNVIDGIPENKVGVSKINTVLLASNLKAVMVKCQTSGLSTAAQTLVQLYTNPKCPQKDLMKLTGLSADGIVKHIRALKKKNLITKVAYQQYTLSDVAIKMLEAARV